MTCSKSSGCSLLSHIICTSNLFSHYIALEEALYCWKRSLARCKVSTQCMLHKLWRGASPSTGHRWAE